MNAILKKAMVLVLFVLCVSFNEGFSRMWELPKSFSVQCKKLDEVDLQKIDICQAEIEKLIKEDEHREADPAHLVPYRFAKAVEAKFSPDRHGTWEYLLDGSRLWRLRIRSCKAKHLNLGITRFSLPEEAKLWVYNHSCDYIEGPYMDKDQTAGQLWTPIIPGEQIVIELYVPFYALDKAIVSIEKVNHGYRAFQETNETAGSRGPCNIDVVCPQGKPWWKQIRSAAFYSLKGTHKCSGVLLNNTRRDFTPYFLTACHCLVDCANAHTMVVYWNYHSDKCCICCDHGQGGNLRDNQSGAFFRARGKWSDSECKKSDFVLVELKEKPHPSFNVYYSGWDARQERAAPHLVVGIHHPELSVKAVSFGHVLDENGEQGKNDAHFWKVHWEGGTVQNGSSGSGLWDASSGLCIGQLRGGPIDCDPCNHCLPPQGANLYCKYGKLSASWQGGGTPNTQLKYWLDPCGTGIRRLKGADPACHYQVSLKQIAVGNEEEIWGVDKSDRVYRWNGSEWESIPCCQKLRQLSVGCDGTVLGVGENGRVYGWMGTCWQSIPTGSLKLKQVSTACKGEVWGLDRDGILYQWAGNTWTPITGSCPLKQVSLGADGTAWGIDEGGLPCRWLGNGFEPPPSCPREKVKYISTSCDLWVWCVDESGTVYKYGGGSFEPKGTKKLKQLSAGCGEIVLGVDEQGSVYRWDGCEWVIL